MESRPTADCRLPTASLWCEIQLSVPVDQAYLVAEALVSVASAGVAIEDQVVPLVPEDGV